MKHVGLNVAADAFMNSAITRTNGGVVLVVADDPGMHSSQDEQDSRYFAQFALIPCLEPKNQQEAYDITRKAFDISEDLKVPVMIRITTRLAHSRSGVEVSEPKPQNELHPDKNIRKWTLMPMNARVQYKQLCDAQPKMEELSEKSDFNNLDLRGKKGIVTCGIAENYFRENLTGDEHDFSVLSIRQYPLPTAKLKELVDHVDEVLVLEDGYPFVENHLRGLFGIPGVAVKGRLTGDLPRTGELDPDAVRPALGMEPLPGARTAETTLAKRPPALCQGCPHHDTFTALNAALDRFEDPQVFSDIGCYTLSALPPLEAIHSCVAMGASIGMAAGAAHSGYTPAVAAIGDSTFAHGGIPPLLSAVQQHVNLNVFILDNGTVAMTGKQRSMSTGEALDELVAGLGIPEEHIRVIEPLKKWHDKNVEIISEELAYDGPSVIIARRLCIEARK